MNLYFRQVQWVQSLLALLFAQHSPWDLADQEDQEDQEVPVFQEVLVARLGQVLHLERVEGMIYY